MSVGQQIKHQNYTATWLFSTFKYFGISVVIKKLYGDKWASFVSSEGFYAAKL